MDLLEYTTPAFAPQEPRLCSPPNEPAFYFSGSRRSMLAEDAGETLDVSGHVTDVCARAVRALLEMERSTREPAVLVGVIPFAGPSRARLSVPRRTVMLERVPRKQTPACVPAAALAVNAAPSAEELRFMASVRDAIAAIRARKLRKVVLARAESFPLGAAPRVMPLLQALRQREPNAFVFSVSDARRGCRLVGASPELLVSKSGSGVSSRPLAGSARRVVDAGRDREIAAALLRSTKDRHEHELVVERIVEDLRPLLRDVRRDAAPTLVGTSAMWHLASHIRGQLKDPRISSLELALALHPTPAVCGAPTAAAREFIESHEPFERGDFTGAIGYMNRAGDGEWVVALRCAELGATAARVFAGAGIVETSDPHSELLETRGKMQTMLQVLRSAEGARS